MLTKDQTKVLQFIVRSIQEEGVSPTIWEVADGINETYSFARNTMMELEKLGFIKRRYGKPRAISVLRRPEEATAAA